MRRRLVLLAGLSLGLSGGSAAAQRPAAPAFPPDVAAQIPPNLRAYFLAFLVDRAEQGAIPHEILVQHLTYMRRQVEAGIYHLAGPLTDQDRIRGIIILSADSIEEARTIVSADPSVQAGLLAVEIHPALLPSLTGFRIEYPPPAH
jgi:uncharacterized protein YciI